MDDPLSCTICFRPVNGDERAPLILPQCGHTFCNHCIDAAELLRRPCPECRLPINGNAPRPRRNYALIHAMEVLNADQQVNDDQLVAELVDHLEPAQLNRLIRRLTARRRAMVLIGRVR